METQVSLSPEETELLGELLTSAREGMSCLSLSEQLFDADEERATEKTRVAALRSLFEKLPACELQRWFDEE